MLSIKKVNIKTIIEHPKQRPNILKPTLNKRPSANIDLSKVERGSIKNINHFYLPSVAHITDGKKADVNIDRIASLANAIINGDLAMKTKIGLLSD